ncbi:MAG TPA: methyltransferase [Chitinophagaceae bacterium]|nr:methyltransferase [Chitinophagaceae bacterium]
MTIATSKDPVGLHTLEVIAKAESFNKWMYQQFKQNLKGEILEIGSGIGNISQLVIEEGYSVTLSDYNEEYCDSLRRMFSQKKNVREIIRIDLLDPDFESKYAGYKEKFDSVFLLNVIEHIEDDLLAVKNCNHLLKHDGHLILLAPAYSWLYSSFDKQLGHYRRYSLTALKELLKKGKFSILSGSYFNFTGIGGWLLFGKILNQKMLSSGEMTAFNKIVPLAKLVDTLVWKKSGLSIIVTGIKN